MSLLQAHQSFHPSRPGLQCYSCGSLLNPNKRCDQFNRTAPAQVQTCLSDEACLMYTWRKSPTETATLRECFPTRVLLGSISSPLVPGPACAQRDITDDGSATIFACLCNEDFCNDDQTPTVSSGRQVTTRRPAAAARNQRPAAAARQRSCPRGFSAAGGSCYLVGRDRVGWIEARKLCQRQEAELVGLETEEEATRLEELVKREGRRRSEYWLGGNDIEQEGR